MKFSLALLAAAAMAAGASAQATVTVTSLEDCHLHGLVQYCIPKPSGAEVEVVTATSEAEAKKLPNAYTDCHKHGEETFCLDADGEDVLISGLSSETETHDDHDDHDKEPEASVSEENCHFHAGVEHCTGGSSSERSCAKVDRSYNIPLRIGSIFIVFVTSALASFLPLILRRFTQLTSSSLVFTIIKQFGTGVIIATAFVHLLTHAELLLGSDCVGELKYEATTTAIAMAGLFVAATVEYVGHRYIQHRSSISLAAHQSSPEFGSGASSTLDHEIAKADIVSTTPAGACHEPTPAPAEDRLSVLVMELGIIFHSILIGITLVVAGDSGFTTLLIVIIFHQSFEGLALGSRIAALEGSALNYTKVFLAGLFSAITPIGMAIGIGVRNHFNGNDRATLIALGTLDAFSAGILVWVGLVEMLAYDWLYGDLKRASIVRTAVAGTSLVAGMVLMGVLGKWA